MILASSLIIQIFIPKIGKNMGLSQEIIAKVMQYCIKNTCHSDWHLLSTQQIFNIKFIKTRRTIALVKMIGSDIDTRELEELSIS